MMIGDTVRCVDPPGTGQLSPDTDYRVTYVEDNGYCVFVSVNVWPTMLWGSHRFVVVPHG